MSSSARGHAQRLHQRPGVGLGGAAGGEARHGEGQDVGPRQAEQVHRPGGHDQRVGGIEPAGDTDHHPLGVDRPEPLDQAVDLDVVGLVAVLRQPLRIGRDEREPLDHPAQTQIVIRRVQGELDRAVRGRDAGDHPAVVLEGALPGAFLAEQIEVDVGDGQLRVLREAGALAEQRAVLEDAGLAVPAQVGGRLALPGRRVQVGRQAAHRLAAAQQAAGVRPADGDRAAGQVRQHRRAGQRQPTGRRHRHEHVLADLDSDGQARDVGRVEQQVGAERRRSAGDVDRPGR